MYPVGATSTFHLKPDAYNYQERLHHTEINGNTVGDAVGSLKGGMGTTSHAKGALVPVQNGGDLGDILGGGWHNHAPGSQSGVGRIVGFQTLIVPVLAVTGE